MLALPDHKISCNDLEQFGRKNILDNRKEQFMLQIKLLEHMKIHMFKNVVTVPQDSICADNIKLYLGSFSFMLYKNCLQ